MVTERIHRVLQLANPIQSALDVGCGTGLSTIALKTLASHIVGTDPSRAMLDAASRDRQIDYVEAGAEQLPFADASFDLLTVASAFHWLDREAFLTQAHRVLRPGGWLVIYDNAFSGQMKENAEFERWICDTYLVRFPTPPRNRQRVTDDDAACAGFRFHERETYINDVSFSVEGLANYLMTQSNVTAVSEKEGSDIVYQWLVRSLNPLFVQPSGTFRFGGPIWYLQSTKALSS